MRVARANLLSAKAKQAQAEIDMEHTLVKATSDGITNRAEVNVGTLVTASSTRLTTLTQPKNLRIKFQLSERDLNGHDVTESNLIRLYDDLGHKIPAKIDFVSQQIDVATATRSVRATILDPTHVYAGQLLRVQIATHQLESVFRIPQRCVQQKPDGSYEVFTVVDEKIQPVQVIVGNWKDTDWVILKGLKGGELIAVNQLQRLREGTSVKTTVVDRKTLP